MTKFIEITQPDDWHVHFRDDSYLQHTAPATAAHFARALVMPNLIPPLTTIDAIDNYRHRILKALDKTSAFEPFMTIYLNETVTAETLLHAAKIPHILGAKLYPAGATTNSDQGARSIKTLYPLLDIMQTQGLVLQIHGEVTHNDIFDRERLFIEEYLQPMIRNFPKLRIVLEHISTKAAVDFIDQSSDQVAATITPHHLLFNRNHMLAGGIKPHYYCLPILKKETDQKAIQSAAISGNPKFFAGTDSAPHAQKDKESACGCAGIFSAPIAVALYTEIFANLGHIDRLNAFMSQFGADFYQLPYNQATLILKPKPHTIPASYPFGHSQVIPIAAGSTLQWSVHERG